MNFQNIFLAIDFGNIFVNLIKIIATWVTREIQKIMGTKFFYIK